ncbi:MAG: GNAT family N-acetyltransferase [Rufibacter sp.]
MNFSVAESATVPELCALFNTAFSDYVQPLVLTEPVLQMKLTRDGTNLSLMPLALNQQEPVGFIMNALGAWQGKRTAYNGGTGVVPHARGHNLTERMYRFCVPLLKEQGAEQCLLEVIQENKRALAIYKRLGFDVARTFHCFKQKKEDLRWHKHAPKEVIFKQVPSSNWHQYQAFWDIEPSWQHHISAIDRCVHYTTIVEAHVLGQCVGYGILYPLTGAIAHLAVAPAWRNQGVGQALMQQLLRLATTPAVTVVNIDEKGKTLLEFVRSRNMQETFGQYEMLWEV